MNFTIADVSNSTGISQGTIKLLESGRSIPRFDTLIILSSKYKCDLLSIFRKSYKDSVSFFLFNDISENSLSNSQMELEEALLAITEHLNKETLLPIDYTDLRQLRIYIEGLKIASSCHSASNPENLLVIQKYEQALTITNPFFSFDFFDNFKYNAIEYNILFSSAVIFGLMRKCNLSNRILNFILNYYIQTDEFTETNRHIISKIYYVLAYNYHRLDNHDKALETTSIGIDYCLNSDTYLYVPMLLARRGIALHNLNSSEWRDPILKAINFLDFQGRYKIKESYEQILRCLESSS